MGPTGLAELVRGAVHLLYPGRCLLCHQPTPDESPARHGLCSACFSAVSTDPARVCPRCAATVGEHTDVQHGCFTCRSHGFRFDAAFRLGPYDGRLREAILRMKKPGGGDTAEVMGTICAETFSSPLRGLGAEVVVPVPLHWRHRFLRGHNQAESMGLEMSRVLGIECRPRWLRRTRAVVQHSQPSASARRENVKGIFAVPGHARLAGRTVLLVDDVMTTGSTLSEAAGTLKSAGAKEVIAAVLARR